METGNLKPILAELEFLKGLPDEYLDLMAGCARNERVQAGEFICRANRDAEWFYVIRQGLVVLETFVPPQGPLRLQSLGEGDVVGWSWLIPPYRWRFDARALEDCLILAIDGICLREKCDSDPKLGYELLKRFSRLLAERLDSTRMQITDVYGPGPEKG